MTRHRLPVLLALALVVLLSTAQRSAALCSATTAQTWTCWEKTLNATAATPAAVGVQDPVDPLIYTFTRPACPGGDPFCASEPDWVLVIP